MPSTAFQPILDAALADYAKQIGTDPVKHPFVDHLRSCHSPDDVLKILEDKANEFKDFRDGNRKLIDCLNPVVKVVHMFSGILGEASSFVPFQPAGAIFAGLNILLATASDVSSSYDALVDLFECIGNFLKRLRIYTELPLTPSMTDIVVKIMVELLSVLALATKQIKQGRFKKFAKKLLGESEIEAVLQRLDRLTQEEGRMTMVQTLEVIHGLMSTVKVVMNDGKASMDGIRKALDQMQQMANDINKIRRDQLQKESRIWLSPPDPSPNYNTACEIHQDGSAMWFFQGSVFTKWNAKGSLLWIHGKPGSGKSILMSSIIRETDRMCKAGLASMAYFYFDFRDTQKQHRRGLLSSLLSQLGAESDSCYHILSQLYSAHAGGTRQPSEDALWECLIEMLQVQGQPAVYIIIDALDECPNISGMQTEREKVLDFLDDLVGLQLPNVHICVSSRPEFDIRTTLEPLALFRVSLSDEAGQKADILGYIKSVVHSDRRMRKWSAEDKQLVISTLSDKADGMFRWVYCQLEILRRCFPPSIRGTLEGLPKTLDATYEYTLRGIDEEKWQFAHRLFQCLAVSVRPLRVEELAEVMAIRFDGALPQLNTSWRQGNAEEAVLTACSSLITITNVNGSQIVQFAHFSVKEFLTSNRFATSSESFSRYHIVPHLAHTTLAQASLGVLLHLDDHIDKESIRNFPLSDYSARHWFDHCQFGNVSLTIQDATKRLFDRGKPHFSAWVWIYDLDYPWRESMPTKHPERPEAAPLYYAILCGFHWLIEHVIVTYPGDIDAIGGYYGTPLLAAIRKENVNVTSSPPQHGVGMDVPENRDMSPLHRTFHSEYIDIVQLLLERKAHVNLPDKVGQTPLEAASVNGKLEVSRLLVQWGADVQSWGQYGCTPLHAASHHGRLDVARFLIDSGADVNPQDNNGWTPLHSASRQGHINIAELLIQRGADVDLPSKVGQTPLDRASASGNLEISQLLVQGGADVRARDKDNCTPLYTASIHKHVDVARFLIDNGADLNSQDDKGWTPLHPASKMGHVNIIELLIRRGADVNLPNKAGLTPLHLASSSGNLEISRLLVQGGADVEARDKDDCTPLFTASVHGHVDVARFLIDNGADLNFQDDKGWTPLHPASKMGHINIIELLIRHGADVNLPNKAGLTPLYLASASLEISRLLVQGGAEVQARDKDDWTPLHTASIHGHLDVARFLIDNGADVNSQNNEGFTPLHPASQDGHVDIVELLIRRGAGVNLPNKEGLSPLHLAPIHGQLKISQLLVQSGADVQAREKDGWTPLHTASQSGHAVVARFLIDSGADVNSQDNEDWTPMHTAASNGHLDVVKLLLEHGADFSIRNNGDRTPMDLAYDKGKPEVADFLSGRMAGSNSLDDAVNTTPFTVSPQSQPPDVIHPPGKRGEDTTSFDDEQPSLYTASENGQLDIVRSLLDRGSDVNERNTLRATALNAASLHGHLEVAKLLIEHGAVVDSRDWHGETPLIAASGRGQLEVARLLIDHGANVKAQTRHHCTALHHASSYADFEMVRLLLEHGATAGVRDNDGETPRQIAQRMGHHKVAELLLGFEQHGKVTIESL